MFKFWLADEVLLIRVCAFFRGIDAGKAIIRDKLAVASQSAPSQC